MKKTITVEANQEIRTPAGKVVATSGQTISLRDDQPHGWPLLLVDTRTNAVVLTLE